MVVITTIAVGIAAPGYRASCTWSQRLFGGSCVQRPAGWESTFTTGCIRLPADTTSTGAVRVSPSVIL